MRSLLSIALLGMSQWLFSQAELFVDIGPSEQFYCPGSTLSLTATTNGSIVGWSTGETSAAIQVGAPGLYSVTVTDGVQSIADSVEVAEIDGPLEVDIQGPYEICQGIPDTLWAVAPQAVSFLWSNGDTTAWTAIDSPDVYGLTVANACGDTAFTDRSVLRLPVPDIEIYTNGQLECPNDRVILSINAPYGLQFNWSDGSTGVFTSVEEPGLYWVEAFNSCGFDRDSVSIETQGKPYPELAIFTDRTMLCQGESATLTAQTNTQGFLVWSTGYVALESIVVDTPGVYEAFFINDCGRTEASISISGPPDLEVAIDAPEDMCEGTPETLRAISANALSFEWSDGTSGSQMSTPTPGNYTVTVTGICGEKTSTSHYIAGVPYPEVVIRQEESLMCDGAQVLLFADALHTDEYEWTTGSAEPETYIDERGLYGVTVRNRCFEASDQVLVTTVPAPAFVPNAFSPNGDQVNDEFRPLPACPDASDYQFRVFSRWGELVFESKSINQGWNGFLNGRPAARGVYVWSLNFRIRDREYHLTGDVMLMN
jgi:gliding motility-associated-like protein